MFALEGLEMVVAVFSFCATDLKQNILISRQAARVSIAINTAVA